jgi:rhodanese-related sulfurtransferase
MRNVFLSSCRMHARVLLLMWTVSCQQFSAECLAADSVGSKAVLITKGEATPFRGPYCGVCSLCGAMRALGKNVELGDLLEPKYVDTPDGSSLAALKQAAEDYGLHATPVMGLSAESLRASPCPVILHVNGLWQSPEYNHWVLYLGTEDDKARILDVPRGVEVVPFAQLLAQWDNTGLLVSDRPLHLQSLAWNGYLPFLEFLAVALGTVMVLHLIQQRYWAESQTRWHRIVARHVVEAVIVCVSAALLAFVWHLVVNEGFFQNPSAVATAKASHNSLFLPKLTLDQLAQRLRSEKQLVVDARFVRDFAAGHIEGAINIPVDSTPQQVLKALAGVPSDTPIVVYCQSKGCGFADVIASLLAFNGYADVSTYPGGWAAWESHQRRKKSASN